MGRRNASTRYSHCDPANPQLVGSFNADESNRIAADGNNACVADSNGKLDINDVSSTSSPQQKGSYTSSGAIGRLTVRVNDLRGPLQS